MSESSSGGVKIADLGRRFLGAFLDLLIPAVIVGVMRWVVFDPNVSFADQSLEVWQLIVLILLTVVLLAWTTFQWWAYGTRKAGFGYRIVGLELVGIEDGKPIGWWRMFIRSLIYHVLMATVIGWIAMLIFLVIEDRRQGWHDLAVKSLAIQRKTVEPKKAVSRQNQSAQAAAVTALPPHLVAAAFEPQTFGPKTSGTGRSPISSAPASFASYPSAPGVQQQAPPAPMITQVPSFGVDTSDHRSFQPPGSPTVSQPREPQPNQVQFNSPSVGQPVSVRQPLEAQPGPRRFSLGQSGLDEDDFAGTALAVGRNAVTGRRAGRRGSEDWFLKMDDGREIDLEAKCLVLVGRNPEPKESEKPASAAQSVILVKSGEHGHTVSKTHLAVGVDPRGVYVTDRNSTNGTAVVEADQSLTPCPPGVQVRVREGQVVSFGDRLLTVMRRPL